MGWWLVGGVVECGGCGVVVARVVFSAIDFHNSRVGEGCVFPLPLPFPVPVAQSWVYWV